MQLQLSIPMLNAFSFQLWFLVTYGLQPVEGGLPLLAICPTKNSWFALTLSGPIGVSFNSDCASSLDCASSVDPASNWKHQDAKDL